MSLTIVADDLTGAADAAGAYGQTHSSAVVFGLDAPWPSAEILAIDTESRYLTESQAAELVASTVRRSVSMGRGVFKKIDSLLRGNVGVEVSAALAELAREEAGIAIVAPAFPATGRTTVGGIVHVNGVPHASGAFSGDVAAALAAGGLTAGRAVAAGSPADIARRIRDMKDQGLHAVVLDATSDADLERIARATELLDFPVLVTGSGGLASHLVPSRPNRNEQLADRFTITRVLVVVGSYSTLAKSQIQELLAGGVHHIGVSHGEARDAHSWVHAKGSEVDVLLTPDLSIPVDKDNAPGVAAAVAAAVRAIADDYDALVLTGGETARAVVDALGVDHMRVLGEIEPGVVVSELSGNRPLLVTKAGAFGDSGTLARIIKTLKSKTTEVSIHA